MVLHIPRGVKEIVADALSPCKHARVIIMPTSVEVINISSILIISNVEMLIVLGKKQSSLRVVTIRIIGTFIRENNYMFLQANIHKQ